MRPLPLLSRTVLHAAWPIAGWLAGCAALPSSSFCRSRRAARLLFARSLAASHPLLPSLPLERDVAGRSHRLRALVAPHLVAQRRVLRRSRSSSSRAALLQPRDAGRARQRHHPARSATSGDQIETCARAKGHSQRTQGLYEQQNASAARCRRMTFARSISCAMRHAPDLSFSLAVCFCCTPLFRPLQGICGVR